MIFKIVILELHHKKYDTCYANLKLGVPRKTLEKGSVTRKRLRSTALHDRGLVEYTFGFCQDGVQRSRLRMIYLKIKLCI